MKRWLCLTLVVVLCIGLCACVKQNAVTGPKQPESTTTAPGTTGTVEQMLLDIVYDTTWHQCFIDADGCTYGSVAVTTLSDGRYLVDGVPTGRWEVDYINGSVRFDGDVDQTYKLKYCDGVYFLAGDRAMWSSDATREIPIKTVSITEENWETYFGLAYAALIHRDIGAGSKDRMNWNAGFALREDYEIPFLGGEITIRFSIDGVESFYENVAVKPTPLGGVYFYDDGQFMGVSGNSMLDIYGFDIGTYEQDTNMDLQVLSIEGTLTLLDLMLEDVVEARLLDGSTLAP